MRITEVCAIGLQGATPEGGWSQELQAEDCVHTLVLVHTDDDLFGVGSAFTSESLVRASLEVLEPLLLHENALEPERVSEKLRRHTFWLGRGGAVTHTISGIDIALWDLQGKALGQPVGRLLGGCHRNRVQPYGSLLMDEPERLRDKLSAAREQGFRAFKIGWGPFGKGSFAEDERIVRAARETIGDDELLMVDAGASDAYWPRGFSWAKRTACMLADYEVRWFEEPLVPDGIDDYRRLREQSPVPIAGGEVLTRRQSFAPWVETGAVDIVQPDCTKVGGLSESRRIGWMAEDHDVQLIPHGWNTAVGLAADLHLASALPCTDLVEYITGSPYVDAIVQTPWQLDEQGLLAIPSSPGLGIDIDWEAVRRFSRTNQDLPGWLS